MDSNARREVPVELAYPEAELVFGLVYAAGTDYTGVQLTLENYIKRFNYKPNVIRLSAFISKVLEKINIGVVLDEKTEGQRISSLMTAGDKLCEIATDDAFVVAGAVADINRNRKIADASNTQEPLPKV